MSRNTAFESLRCLLLLGLLGAGQCASAIAIRFDYSYDANDFFSEGSLARTALLAAGDFFADRLDDVFTPINPGGSDSWTARFTNPNTGSMALEAVDDLVIGNEMLVFVGTRDLAPGELGRGGPGTQSVDAGSSQAFIDAVTTRGQGVDDFGSWGGSLAVDTRVWHLDLVPGPSSGSDLFANLLHELGHVLGFGTSAEFFGLVNGSNQFVGPTTGTVDLDPDGAHLKNGTMSTVAAGPESYIGALAGSAQEAAMDPTLAGGTRKLFTDLDFAVLDDIGWEVSSPPTFIPLPASLWLLLSGTIVLGLNRVSIRGASRAGR